MSESREMRAGKRGHGTTPRLSYKFQRLREQLRDAIIGGEFEGRMPGERDLGRRFGVNAKTVNKALNDLSSEGLVVRRIGCGTFVNTPGASMEGLRLSKTVRFLTADLPDANAQRGSLVEAVRQGLERMGHHFAMSRPAQPGGSGLAIPLKAWPAATRRETDYILTHPYEPLSGTTGRLSDDCLAEAIRRHIPTMVLAASSHRAKLAAVVPDYADAGYRLTEHLIQSGKEFIAVLLSTAESREANLVWTGCQAAGNRYRRDVTQLLLNRQDPETGSLDMSEGHRTNEILDRWLTGGDASVGLVCVGSKAIRSILDRTRRIEAPATVTPSITCVLEPGDPTARQHNLTSYEVEPQQLADWVVRLLPEIRPGQRPVEAIVPGVVHVRHTTSHGAASPCATGTCGA